MNDDVDKMLSQQRRPKTAPAKNDMSSGYLDSSLEESMSQKLFNSKNGGGRNKKNLKTNFEEGDDEKQSTKENDSKTNADHNSKKGSSTNSESKKGINLLIISATNILTADCFSCMQLSFLFLLFIWIS